MGHWCLPRGTLFGGGACRYFTVPSYGEWLRDRPDYSKLYTWHKQMLRHLSTACPPAAQHKPWVLKTPFHMASLDALVTEYPEARVCLPRRPDPRARAVWLPFGCIFGTRTPVKFDRRCVVFAAHHTICSRAVQIMCTWERGKCSLIAFKHQINSTDCNVCTNVSALRCPRVLRPDTRQCGALPACLRGCRLLICRSGSLFVTPIPDRIIIIFFLSFSFLFFLFPPKKMIMMHRRPVRAMTSLSAFQFKLRTVTTDVARPKAMGLEVFSLWDALAARAVKVREAWSSHAGDEGQEAGATTTTSPPGGGLVDVALTELHTDPMGAVRRIYTEFGLELSPAAEARMQAFLANNGRDKHGKNRYKTEWFAPGSPEDLLAKYGGLKKYDDYYCTTLFPGTCE